MIDINWTSSILTNEASTTVLKSSRKVNIHPSNFITGKITIILVNGKGISNFSHVRPLNIKEKTQWFRASLITV